MCAVEMENINDQHSNKRLSKNNHTKAYTRKLNDAYIKYISQT